MLVAWIRTPIYWERWSERKTDTHKHTYTSCGERKWGSREAMREEGEDLERKNEKWEQRKMLKRVKKKMERKWITWKKIHRIKIPQRSRLIVPAEVNVCQWYGFSAQQQCWWMGAQWPFIHCACVCMCVSPEQYLSISRRDEKIELSRNFLLSEWTLNH